MASIHPRQRAELVGALIRRAMPAPALRPPIMAAQEACAEPPPAEVRQEPTRAHANPYPAMVAQQAANSVTVARAANPSVEAAEEAAAASSEEEAAVPAISPTLAPRRARSSPTVAE